MARKPPKIIRRKPEEERKEEVILVRVTDDQKTKMLRASKREGLSLSGWLRQVGLNAAKT